MNLVRLETPRLEKPQVNPFIERCGWMLARAGAVDNGRQPTASARPSSEAGVVDNGAPGTGKTIDMVERWPHSGGRSGSHQSSKEEIDEALSKLALLGGPFRLKPLVEPVDHTEQGERG